ncbi:MAG: GmrSD restriction endonuclease domain-containing protein [Halanaerobiales bacterium]
MPEIGKLLDKVESNEIVLPEFQREFVWKKSQAKELMISLYNNYPIGSLLIWETENPPEIKNDAVNREQYGLFKVLLDGQQRLTVLYLLINDNIPPYYKKSEINYDPRNLCFSLESGEFRFSNKTIKESLTWVKVVDVFANKVNILKIAKEKSENDNEQMKIAENFQNKLNSINKIKNLHMPLEELPKSADVHQAIDLFNKVNTQGTELGDAELALAHMSAQWPYIRREIKIKQNDLKDRGYDFDLVFYVKCLVGVLTKVMTYEKAYNITEEKLVKKWERTANTLDMVVNFLKNEAEMPDSSYFSTRAVVIPLIVYVEQNDIRLNHDEKRSFLYWLYSALIWSRYGGSTDTRLEKDISLLSKSNNPTQKLVDEIEDQRGRLEIQESDIRKKGKISKSYYNMVKILVRANNPVDWKTGEPLRGNYNLESHHVFPKSRLYDELFDSKNSEHIKLVNEISNRVFLTDKGNKEISNNLPEEYLPEVKRNYPRALEKQFIPQNKELWKIDNYEDFLKKRRRLLAEAINKYLENIRFPSEDNGKKSLEEIIKEGESQRIEFKETFLHDVYQNRPNKELKNTVAKEVAALANSDGGNIIIGVKDNPIEVKGLKRDIKLMKKGLDEFEVRLNQVLSNKLGDSFTSLYTRVSFEDVEGKKVCVITIEPSPDPVYYKGNEFYVRSGTSCRELDIKEANKYINENWQ